MKHLSSFLFGSFILLGCFEGKNDTALVFKASYRSPTDSGHIFLSEDGTYQRYSGSTAPMGSSLIQEGTYFWRDSIIKLNDAASVRRHKTDRYVVTSHFNGLDGIKKVLRPIDAGLNIVDSQLIYAITQNQKDSLP